MKIGIYTAHIVHNHGAQLQAYATVKFLQDKFPNAQFELVNVITSPTKYTAKTVIKALLPQQTIRRHRFTKFHEQLPHSSTVSPKELFNNPFHYDLHIVGSDQVWNISKGIREYPVYFLPFVKDEKKISLASSFGTKEIPESTKSFVKKTLGEFDSLSVRETNGVNILKDIGLYATQILDPTFWLEKSEWEEISNPTPLINKEYIAAYGFEPSNKLAQYIIDKARKTYKLPVVGIDAPYKLKFDKNCNSLGPREFVNIIKNSKLMLTGSFHGTAMSIILNKDFFVLPHSTRNSRMENLLSQLNLNSRQLNSKESIDNHVEPNNSIEYSNAGQLINEARTTTKEYIINTLSQYII